MSSDLLSSVLTRDSKCEATAIHPNDLLREVATNEVDVVVIGADLNSESGSGFDLANAVSRARPKVYIVILLNETTREMVIDAFRSGARGVFSRQHPMADFLDCIEHVRKGFLWAGREETSCLLEAFKSIPAPNLINAGNGPALTARELQVVQCAATGKTNRTIATELNLSEHTVKNYLFRAFEKLGVSSRVELLFYLTTRENTFNSKRIERSEGDLNVE
jgi:DNA-binding NarL/FixJ family response regulator